MFVAIIIFVLGLTIGSFLNVLTYRLPKGLDFVVGRSKCQKCSHVLAWLDIIPLFSFTFLKGRCRYCKRSISKRYFFVEILTGLLFLTLFILQQPDSLYGYLDLSFWLFISSTLLVLAFIDLDYFIIFDKILLVLFVVGLAYQFLRGYVFWLEPAVVGGSLNISHNLLTAFLSFAIFLLIFLVTKGKGIGMGDIKLFFVLGFLFGFPAILVIVYIALIAGMVWGLALILFFGASMKSRVAFGFVLANAAIVFILFSQFLITKFTPYVIRLYL
ncbi:MAG TPA: prepilin peptidase [Candidatus Paceibacterota bacterium]